MFHDTFISHIDKHSIYFHTSLEKESFNVKLAEEFLLSVEFIAM